MHNHMELLRTSLNMDARLKAIDPKAVKLPPGPIKPLLPVEEDEFGGNENNRAAAAKLAAAKACIEHGTPMPVEPVAPKDEHLTLTDAERDAAMKAVAIAANRPAPAPGDPVATTPAPVEPVVPTVPAVPWNPNA